MSLFQIEYSWLLASQREYFKALVLAVSMQDAIDAIDARHPPKEKVRIRAAAIVPEEYEVMISPRVINKIKEMGELNA